MVVTCSTTTYAQSPENDCANAVPLCNNAGSNGIVDGYGNDDYNGAGGSGCLGIGSFGGSTVESNSAWYTFTLAESGQFGFDITPIDASEDWDFALYGPFSSTTGNCSQVATMDPIRGNYAINTGATGIGASGTLDCADDSTFMAYSNWLNVNTGETYVLMINNYSNTNSGFTLNFTGSIFSGSSSNPLDCNVIDTIDYCTGDLINLDATVPNAVNYVWTADGNPIAETGPILSGILASNTTYNSKAYNSNGDLVGENTFIVAVRDNNAGADGTALFCANDSPSDLFTNLGGTPDAGGSWSPALASGTGVFDPQVDSGGVYTYTVDNGICPPDVATVTVTNDNFSIAVIGGDQQLCDGDPPYDINLTVNLASGTTVSSYNWYTTDPLSPIGNSSTLQVNVTGTYNVEVTNSNGCTVTDQVTIVYNTPPDAGLDNSVEVCSNAASVNLFSSLNGAPDTGGIWSPALASGTGVFNPTTDAAGIYTYTVNGNGCPDATAQITVSVSQLSDAGTDGTASFCSTDTTTDLFLSLGGNPDSGGTWLPALTSGSGVFDPAVDPSGVYTYTVASPGSCPPVSATVNVNVDQLPNAGSNSTIDLCSNDSPIDLFAVLGNSPDVGGIWSPALISGTNIYNPMLDDSGIYTYTISNGSCPDVSATVTVNIIQAPDSGIDVNHSICSNATPIDLFDVLGGTPDTGGIWSPMLSSGTGVFDPAIDNPGVYTYTVTGISPCADSSSQVTVSLDAEPNAGTDGTIELCTTDASVDLFSLLGGTPETGGVWSPSLSGNSGVFNPAIDQGGIYTYTVTNGSCTEATSLVEVNLFNASNAGTDGAITFCTGDAPVDLYTLLGGSPQTGGSWSPALNSGTGVFDPLTDIGGVYTYTVFGDSVCADDTATVDVMVGITPNSGEDGDAFFCISDGPSDLIDLLSGTPDSGGTWSPSLASGTGIFDPALDNSGTYTYTVVGAFGCESSSIVSIELSEAPSITEIITDDFSENNIVTVMVEGTFTGTPFGIGDYEYAYDLSGFQDSNVFENVPAGNYTMTVRDKNGCLPDASQQFSVVGAPNFFTPNNDGVNDFWQVLNLEIADLVNPTGGISIFDRFGKLVAVIVPGGNGWDGIYNGSPLPETDYWYSVEVYDAENNPVLKRGHFSLIRR